MIISPLLVIISSSVNVYIMTQVTAITSKLALLKMASPLIFLLLKLLPFGLIWLLFILIYIVLPNTRVQWISALIAGFIGGAIFHLTQGFYINAQVLLAKYNAIYGSFAALPFFLIWLQLSWMIVLLGAQIAYAHQHVDQYAMQVDYQEMSAYAQKAHAMNILRLIVANFEQGGPPLEAKEIATRLSLHSQLVSQLVEHLITGKIVSAVTIEATEEIAYQPARDIHGITVADVLSAWDKTGPEVLSVQNDCHLERIRGVLEALEKEMKRIPANRLVKDL